jgi:hypothetical protein
MDFKVSSVKWFGEDVTGVCFCGNISHLKALKLCCLRPHIVISQADMSGSFVD